MEGCAGWLGQEQPVTMSRSPLKLNSMSQINKLHMNTTVEIDRSTFMLSKTLGFGTMQDINGNMTLSPL